MLESGGSRQHFESLEIGGMRSSHQGRACSPSTNSFKKGKKERKVMFPSAEDKKQRNRDSQATCRERRKEHISELEKVVQDQKDKLQELQKAHASAKEEILGLKYKKSLLDRILIEQSMSLTSIMV
ncbi:bZIP transcription factor (MeaB) [Diplocarpon rosae]|nr:bZIP transcription factor (MeaB) [Diplocarpon rosae]